MLTFKYAAGIKEDVIRHARPEDARDIWKLAQQLRLDYSSPQTNGFLVYVLDENRYRQRIAASPFFYVADTGNKLDGFLMCYDERTLRDLNAAGDMSHEDGTVEFVLSQEGPYVFGDQIGVAREEQGHGIGHAMMRELFKEMRESGISAMYGAILHKPFRNASSINFFSGLNSEKVSEIANKDSLVWGIYRTNAVQN